MINIIPQTEVRLLKTPLEKDSEHTLSFNNINAQTNYFLNSTFKTFNDFTYQRENQSLVVPETYDNICTCNYLMYKNNGFNSKFFYAFITKMEYISENSTRIYFEIDSLQTWYFNINYNEVFVEREHVNNDGVGVNTIPEGLETGDYIDQAVTTTENDSFNYFKQGHSRPLVVISVTQTGISAIDGDVGRMYNGIYSGLINITFPNASAAETCMLWLDSQFSESPVVAVYLVPQQIANPDITDWDVHTDSQHPEFDFYFKVVPESSDLTFLNNAKVTKLNYLDNDYVPVNKKLLTYPYRYFLVDNNIGGCFEFKYEYFSDTDCNFQIDGAISVGCSIKIRPKNYNKLSGVNNLYGIEASKLPTCAWINDAYTNYLTGNAVNIAVNYGVNAGMAVANAVGGNPAGAVSSVTQMLGLVGSLYEKSKMPLQAHGGVSTGDFNYAGQISFNVYKKSIKKEFAKVIDSFFSMYGYKVNALKVPNITGRRNWNYVKTVNCNFTGDIPQEDLQKIKDIFNRGITFWHNSNNFLNYSVNNDII